MTPLLLQTLRVGLVGTPNSGKSTLFNRLTGMHQKTANYPGVTVEKKVGTLKAVETAIELIDLPGTYLLADRTEEEKITKDVLLGKTSGMPPLNGVLCVLEGTAFEKGLPLALQLSMIGVRWALVLNMNDEMKARGGLLDVTELQKALDVPVFLVSAKTGEGLEELRGFLEKGEWTAEAPLLSENHLPSKMTFQYVLELRRRAERIAARTLKKEPQSDPWTQKLDAVFLHPRFGPVIFFVLIWLIFQSLFSWATPLMDAVDAFFSWTAGVVTQTFPKSLWASFLADGLIAGVGSVVVFLPQILILFFYIGFLEQSGYMARAAVVMDEWMRRFGLQGRSFLPLLSSYACAVPGILATRVIEDRRDRLATIFVAPFMTCSARLPVYTLLITAFIPDRSLLGGFLNLRTLIFLGLYVLGASAAVVTARLLKSTFLRSIPTPFFLEIPPYRWPTFQSLLVFLKHRAVIFMRRVAKVIVLVTLVLWVLASFPRPPEGIPPSIEQSYAAVLGRTIEPLIKPMGFDWKIGIGLITSLAAREVIVATLATLYHVEGAEAVSGGLQEMLRTQMSIASGLSLLVFFVFALQCFSTVAVVQRETGGWRWPAFQFFYMLFLACGFSLLTYQVASRLI